MERAFQCLGDDLEEFLTTLDGVHDVLKYQEDAYDVDHEGEAFICTTEEDFLKLDFTTERPAVAYLLVGSLKAIAKTLYDTSTEVTVNQSANDSRYFTFKIKYINEEQKMCFSRGKSVVNTDLRMGVTTFCKAFPWHFILDRRLEFIQLGCGFMRLFGRLFGTLGKSVATYFEFQRPRSITLSFEEIVKRANTPFVLILKSLTGEEAPVEVSWTKYFQYFLIN